MIIYRVERECGIIIYRKVCCEEFLEDKIEPYSILRENDKTRKWSD
jgi:hypothetical protein